MPFPEHVRRKEIDLATHCAICRDPFPQGAYVEVHSATSLHLVSILELNQRKFLVTDPPAGHEKLKGKALNSKVYSQGEISNSDAICLCPACHDEIHRIALLEARRDQNFVGKAPPPQLLEEITLFFVGRGKPIVYDSADIFD